MYVIAEIVVGNASFSVNSMVKWWLQARFLYRPDVDDKRPQHEAILLGYGGSLTVNFQFLNLLYRVFNGRTEIQLLKLKNKIMEK